MRVLFVFMQPRARQAELALKGIGHDNNFNGMFRLRKWGIETDFIEPEQFVPPPLARLWRRVLDIHWMHVPLYPLFFRYDIVFAGSAYVPLLLHALLPFRRPRWVIYDTNISGTIGGATTLRQRLLKFAVSHVDGVITISKAEETTLREMFPHLGERAKFFYEGVDTAYFAPHGTSEANPPYILSVGLDPSRDFKTLIEAVRGTPIQLRIATKPERLAGIDLPENVTARRYPPEEMRELYAGARLVVIGLNIKKGSNDSMGTYAVIETMASGKALIATRTKAFGSYIEDGVTGMFVPAHDVDALRAKILELWKDPTLCRALGARAREFIAEHADAEVYAKALAEYLKKLVA